MRVACPAISSSSNSSFPLYLLSSVVCEVRHCVIISILPPHLSLSIQAFGRHYCLSPTHHFHTRIWSPVLSVCLLHTTSIHAFGRQYCLSVSCTPLPYTHLVASTVCLLHITSIHAFGRQYCLSPTHHFHTQIWSPVLSVCLLHTTSIHAFGRQYCLSPAHHFHTRIWSPVLSLAHHFHTRIWSSVLSVACTPFPYTHLVASTVCLLHTTSMYAFGRQYCVSVSCTPLPYTLNTVSPLKTWDKTSDLFEPKCSISYVSF